MSINDFHAIVVEVNSRAKDYQISSLQEIRKKLKGKRSLMKNIFTSQTTFDRYAFHHGGRKELQFNIAIENRDGMDELRFGVAFSFVVNQSLPSIDVLKPKVRLFNEFMELYPDEYADMLMWSSTKREQSPKYEPKPIPPELVTNGIFVFLGKLQLLPNIDYDLLLKTLDRLLPLYQYIESKGALPPIQEVSVSPFQFRPGYTTDKVSSTKISQAQRELDSNLRHNILLEALCKKLSVRYGAECVGAENSSGIGTRIDVVVRRKSAYWFYEIKTAHSPRACIRQALGQLLEYAFWNDSQKVTRLIVVGELPLDKEGAKYLSTLRKRFSLPIEYEHITI
ncbi:MAG: hypothetical protein HZB50_18805 [Chloroflexi bacterium]|nr:hypothetical protein [Chloroflexota bacterium]